MNTDEEYYEYIPAWHKLCNRLSEGLRKEVMQLADEWFQCPGEDVSKAKFFEINSRADKIIPPYHYFYERMNRLKKDEGVGFSDGSGVPMEKPAPRAEPKWTPVGTATLLEDGFKVKFNDGTDTFLNINLFNKKRDDFYTTKLDELPTNLFKKGENWTVHQHK